MRLIAEFTTEPFIGEGDPPPHASAALRVARAAGLECDFGPLGTSVSGPGEAVLPALAQVMAAAFAHGATRLTLQVEPADD